MTAVSGWGSIVAARLVDQTICPVCGVGRLANFSCSVCGADLSGQLGRDLWNASVEAAAAVRARDAILQHVPQRVGTVAARETAIGGSPDPASAAAPPAERPAPAGLPHPPRQFVGGGDAGSADPAGLVASSPEASPAVPGRFAGGARPPYPPAPHVARDQGARGAARSSATVQSVLAVAGAGLFAIAALVFTFLNPDLADRSMRSAIIGAVTLMFLAGAWGLARRRLQFSAEAVGSLGIVFLALDVVAVAQGDGTLAGAWRSAAAATAAAALLLLAAGYLARIRIWVGGGLIGLALVPAMLGWSSGSALLTMAGHLAAAFLAAGCVEFLGRLAPRLVPVAPVVEHGSADPASAASPLRPPSSAATALTAPADRPRRPLAPERRTLIALQLIAVLVSVPLALAAMLESYRLPLTALAVAGIFALTAGHGILATRQAGRTGWSFLAGGFAAVAVTIAANASGFRSSDVAWWGLTVPAAAALVVAILPVLPLPRTVSRPGLASGALCVAILVVAPGLFTGWASVFGAVERVVTALAGLGGTGADPAGTGSALAGSTQAWAIGGVAASALLLALLGRLARRLPELRVFTGGVDVFAFVLAESAAASLVCDPDLLSYQGRIAVALLCAGILAVLVRVTAPGRAHPRSGGVSPWRTVLLLGGHGMLALALVSSWSDPGAAPFAGIPILAVLGLTASGIAPMRRFVHVGAGFGYALLCLASALGGTTLAPAIALCLVTSVGLVGAILATFWRRVSPRDWYAVLVVTAVPFVVGIVQVIFERSGWTALSTAFMFALALTLLLTRRPGLGIALRTAAAALLVPSIAVVIVCLGAQLLPMSASPVTLPIIAVVVAAVLPATAAIREALRGNGLSARAADAARIGIEGSALLTAAIAVGLALGRVAAGLGTAFLVLVVLGVGAGAAAVFARRRYGWWLAAASFTGALWCVWGLAGVTLAEAYTLPPALGAAAIALVLVARRARAGLGATDGAGADAGLGASAGRTTIPDGGAARAAAPLARQPLSIRGLRGLYAAGLGVAIVPPLALLIVEGLGRGALGTEPPGAPALWRGAALLAGAWLLWVLGLVLRRGTRVSALAAETWAAAVLAAVSGPVLGILIARGGSGVAPPAVFFGVLGLGAVAALVMGLSAFGARAALGLGAAGNGPDGRRSRWWFVPATLAIVVPTWWTIRSQPFSIAAVWLVMLAVLVMMLMAAVRGRRTLLPPVWFLFALAFVTAVVAWSPRELRVECFSLPLGAFLLAAGTVGMRRRAEEGTSPRLPDAWPQDGAGSWILLSPGIVVLLSASMAATFTDPLTWRAILVMVLALAAILVGASRRLAAPFVLGMIVLPIENVLVFAVQIGRGIASMPWWITLAVIGAVLLIIAVTYERRSAGASARLRDLR